MSVADKSEILEKIIQRVWKDEEFKHQLIQQPIKTIERYFNVQIKLPEGKQLVILDQTNNENLYINIPTEPSIENLALSDDQLESIAGGFRMDFNQLIGEQRRKEILSIIR